MLAMDIDGAKTKTFVPKFEDCECATEQQRIEATNKSLTLKWRSQKVDKK
jgi:hypothetical protein